MRFINRQVTTPNKKILTVEHTNYDPLTGEISQLTVTEQNDEGDVTIEGTKLNATNLNSIFDNLGRNFFCHHYYNELYGIDINEDDYSIELVGTTPKQISITYNEGTLIPSFVSNQYFSFTVINNNTIKIEKNNIDLLTPRNGKIKINFITPIEEQETICTISIIYSYTPSSTNPLD